MTEAASSGRIAAFESASELREAHTRLLEELDVQLGPGASAEGETAALARLEPEIRQFVERGAATGAYIEEITERTACQSLLDYWVSSLSHAGTHIGGVRLARFDGELLPDLKNKPCPYMGLEAFRNRDFFFGRERDIKAILAQLHDAPLVVVAGASGSGKSSLVIGGVLPAITEDGRTHAFRIIPPIVPGNAVLDHLATAVLQLYGDGRADIAAEVAALRNDPQALAHLLGGPEAAPALITIDQFEEVFTLSDHVDRELLVAHLAQLLEAGRGHRVILTMREEFRNRIVGLGALSRYLDTAWYSMRPMGYDELRAAVESPAALVNLQFHSGIVDDLVKKVLGQPAALPLLQFALRSLWDERDRNRITWEVYRRIGDPLNALKSSADRFYDGLVPETQDEVKRVLLALVRVDELLEAYRQPVAIGRLLQAGRANTEDVLELLASNDYVRITSEPSGAGAVVEVKHESLVRNWPRFVGWIDEKRVQVRQRFALAQAAQRWAGSGKPQDGLLTGWQLQAAEGQSDLSDLEKEYLETSSKAIDSKRAAANRRSKWVLVAAVCVAIIAALGSAVLLAQNYEIERKSHEIMRQKRLIQLLNGANVRRDLALLIGIEAYREAPDEPDVSRSLLSNLTTNLELRSFLRGHTGAVTTVTYSSSGKVLASASTDETIILWDVASGRMLLPPLKGHSARIYKLAFSETGKMLASASGDGTVRLWDTETGKLLSIFPHPATVYSVAISNYGNVLASACADGIVRMWNLKSREQETKLTHSEIGSGNLDVYNVVFNHEGTLLASGGKDQRIILWNVQERSQAGDALVAPQEVFSLAFSHDGKTIAAGGQEGHVDLWDIGSRKWIRGSNAHLRGVYGVAFSPDDKQLATVSSDRGVYIHDVQRLGSLPMQLAGYADQFRSVDFAEGGKLATGTERGVVVLWDLNKYYSVARPLQSQTNRSTSLVFTGDSKTLAWYSKDRLEFWPVEKLVGTPASVDAGEAEVKLMVPEPNGKGLVTVGWDNSIKLWNVTTQPPRATPVQSPHIETIEGVAVSANSQILAVAMTNAQNEGEIRLLSMPEGNLKKVVAMMPQDQLTSALAFSPDGKLLAFARWDTGITIWNVDTSKIVKSLDYINIFSLAFSPKGNFLASGGKDSVIRLWDIENDSVYDLEFHRGPVMSVAFSPDGKRLASGSSDMTVLLWDVATRQQMSLPLDVHGDTVDSVAFSRDGRWLASSAQNGSIHLWQLSMPDWLVRACEIAGRNFSDEEWKQFFGDEPFRISCPDAAANKADMLALTGDHAGAEQLFDEALRAALQANDEPEFDNVVCWLGSIDGFATMVKPACEKAVELAPESRRDWVMDSRGLDRALTGDTTGAIEDFTAVVEHIKEQRDHGSFSEAFLQRREDWIAKLKERRNPFDDRLLNALRTDDE